jgi:hypothetical protein
MAAGFSEQKRPDHLTRGRSVQQKISIGLFLTIKQATRRELAFLERSDLQSRDGERVTRSSFQERFTGFAEIRNDSQPRLSYKRGKAQLSEAGIRFVKIKMHS